MSLGFPSAPARRCKPKQWIKRGAAVKLRSQAFFFVHYIEQTFAGPHFSWRVVSPRHQRPSPASVPRRPSTWWHRQVGVVEGREAEPLGARALVLCVRHITVPLLPLITASAMAPDQHVRFRSADKRVIERRRHMPACSRPINYISSRHGSQCLTGHLISASKLGRRGLLVRMARDGLQNSGA